MLINTVSGRLCNKWEQVLLFESQPIFGELVSSMTTHITHSRIKHEVKQYYRYATFSHKWEDNEPLFEKVLHTTVYDLEESLTHDKLKMFCKIVQDAGFDWAWTDTCCINKADHSMIQEAVVAMSEWFWASAMTIVLLRGVGSPSQHGDLVKNIWNTRAWPFQEYLAANVVRFYTEDWTPYLNPDIPNHKESPKIISEMEEATGVSMKTLMALRPGLDHIWEKLYIASRRKTTLVEDAAYSLVGIFSVYLPVVYGEGNKALGRLLAELLTKSGDTSILAWTGRSGSFNSCLPANITVFNKSPTSHIPPPMFTLSPRSAYDMSLVMSLYNRIDELPVALFAGQRMKLPCITFKLEHIMALGDSSEGVYRAQTAALGNVEISTKEDLSGVEPLYLAHPWINFLLDRQFIGGISEKVLEENRFYHSSSVDGLRLSEYSSPPKTRMAQLASRFGRPFNPYFAPKGRSSIPHFPSPMPQTNEMLALHLMARLEQPFGALLFTPSLGSVAAYRRVATENVITVQIQQDAPLDMLIDNVRVLDVL